MASEHKNAVIRMRMTSPLLSAQMLSAGGPLILLQGARHSNLDVNRNLPRCHRGAYARGDDQADRCPLRAGEMLAEKDEAAERGNCGLEAHEDAERPAGQSAERAHFEREWQRG